MNLKEFRIKKEKELTMTEQERFMTYEVVPDIESKYYKEKIGYEELFTDIFECGISEISMEIPNIQAITLDDNIKNIQKY